MLLNLVYAKAFTIGWDADKDPNNDFDLIKNQDRIYQNKLYPQVYKMTTSTYVNGQENSEVNKHTKLVGTV